jgi:hypothetical protein
MRYFGVFLDFFAHFKTVHARHHHVEQDQVGFVFLDFFDGFEAIFCGDNVVIFAVELGFEQLDIGGHVIDDENLRGHATSSSPRKRRTVLRNDTMEMGLEI